ncbi:hypothetical protein [Streptomyces sp. NPDC020362]|uniref:DUF7737 domain-containing protein n=1 Tax=unclassified Streptomyces TaxID=2593676 RepID=UPI0033D2AF32
MPRTRGGGVGAGPRAAVLRAPAEDVPLCSGGDGKVFLPFEDERLSVILSKAFLLAADARITDRTIVHQIKRGA